MVEDARGRKPDQWEDDDGGGERMGGRIREGRRREVHRRRVASVRARGGGWHERGDRPLLPRRPDALARAPRRAVPVRPDRPGTGAIPGRTTSPYTPNSSSFSFETPR